ncbi:MAG TPA: DegV family protein [Aggregatilineaceae bacterium]|nr:DegV family protein [Aggregatilineaceae bacterium]
MAHTALVTDSTCNLYPELAAEKRIHIVPLYILWDDASYKDGVDLKEPELFRRLASTNHLPKTSQASPQDFVEAFRRVREAEQADAVVCAVISSDLSGTYASAVQARDTVDFPVHVVDTRQASWALGYAVLSAAAARDAGAGLEDIAEAVRKTAAQSHILFTIESLDYLYYGGRIGNASRLLGSALNIKPVLELKDGIVSPVDKVRTRKRAVANMLQATADCAAGRPIRRLAVIHGDVEHEAQTLLDEAAARFNPEETYLSYATAVLGVHIGPGALGIVIEWWA